VWGILAAPLLAYKTGVVYSWSRLSFMHFAWNLAGLLAISCWSLGCSFMMFGIMRLAKQLRVDRDIELKGIV
jgi:ammonia channel protein AmtB